MALADLPDINFINVDAAETQDNIIAIYEGLTERTLYPGDPVRLFLTSLAQIIVQQKVLINYNAKQNLLRYASGGKLDNIGARSNVRRLPATPARTTLSFQLSATFSAAVNIPAGTRVGLDDGSDLYFATVQALEIPAGSTSGTVAAECTIPGGIGNGFTIGQVNVIIDPLPFVQEASNTTVTAGGADEETDNAYRERIHIAPESFSVAGPDGAYKFWAASANQLIVDVSVKSPTPGVVEIIPLLQGGEIPGTEILNAVAEKCNDEEIRPLTDNVTVRAPEVYNYDIGLTYWINKEDVAAVASIQTAVESAVQAYALWQKSRLGRDINPSELVRRVMQAGAYRVDTGGLSYYEVDYDAVAIAQAVTVTYGGLADD